MNIDKFGRINYLISLDLKNFDEIDKLENMIILLKSEMIELTDRINGIIYVLKTREENSLLMQNGEDSNNPNVDQSTQT